MNTFFLIASILFKVSLCYVAIVSLVMKNQWLIWLFRWLTGCSAARKRYTFYVYSRFLFLSYEYFVQFTNILTCNWCNWCHLVSEVVYNGNCSTHSDLIINLCYIGHFNLLSGNHEAPIKLLLNFFCNLVSFPSFSISSPGFVCRWSPCRTGCVSDWRTHDCGSNRRFTVGPSR